MKPERWEQVEKVYQEALRHKQSDRAGFLVEACHGDRDMRREVDSLLEFQEKTNGFMESSAFDVVAQMIAPDSDPADEIFGPEFAHYSVVEKLGSGGMGVVYKARDERLHRFVALKILPQSFTVNQERLRLFEREARSASALNHPNVVTIYEVGHVETTPYIAMEFVEGSTLRQLLARGPLPIPDVLRLADQLAGGLAKIHASGLIHGDLKPENIMITEDGLAKILDFGLARLAQTVDVPTPSKMTDTSNTGLAGTVSYMSPEQVLGRTRDFRSDQFSLGCILYEMVTGLGAFRRETTPQTRDAIIRGERKPIEDSRPGVPKQFCGIVERCLEMEPERRYDSTMDLVRALRDFRETQTAPRVQGPSRSRRRILYATAIVIVALAATFGISPLRERLFGSVPFRSTKAPSLGVLPVVNKSVTEDAEIFADGLTGELIREIQKFDGLHVLSPTTMMYYKNSKKTTREIARELDVENVLNTSILQIGKTVQITPTLTEASSGRVLLNHEYGGSLEDVVKLQGEIAREVAGLINAASTPAGEQRIAVDETVDMDSHWDYYIGQNEYSKWSAEGLRNSSEAFTRSIQKDRKFAQGYAALSNSYIVQSFLGMLLPSEGYPAARDAANEALVLEPGLAEAHTALGRILTFYDRDWIGAESEFSKAIRLNRNSPEAYQWYADLLVVTGRFPEAIEMNRRAVKLDPRSPRVHTNQGWIFYLVRRYPEAIEEFMKALSLDETSPQALDSLADAYEESGRLTDSFEYRQAWAAAVGITERNQATLKRAFVTGGIPAYWQIRLKMETEEEQRTHNQWTYLMAKLNARVGNREKALEWLKRAFDEDHDRLIFLRVEPVFDFLRTDSRFETLVKSVGFPKKPD